MVKTMYMITKNGEIKEIPFSPDKLQETALIIDDNSRKIYLWVSNDAETRQKFIAAQMATKIKREKGINYKIRSIEEGEEIEELRSALV
ncbi:MAG: hypothetical protein ACTSSJ_02275 [Candidatus Odinarchaeia archaeon]